MGVKDLWRLLDGAQEDVMLSSLENLRLAVDLAIWVVEADNVTDMRGRVLKPHLRNIFFRVSNMIEAGIKLVFIIDGEAPQLKWETLAKRHFARFKTKLQSGVSRRAKFHSLLNESRELLELLGVPVLQATGEAEALCAKLSADGMVDGVITNDGDAFLYGAKVVYRNISANSKNGHVEKYSVNNIYAKLLLSREDFIGLAVLHGCDFLPSGVVGVGLGSVQSLLKEIKGKHTILSRLRSWHQGNSKISPVEKRMQSRAVSTKGYPFHEVIDEFFKLDSCTSPCISKEHRLKIFPLVEYLVTKLEWTESYAFEKVISLALIYDLRQKCANPQYDPGRQCFLPERIVAARSKNHQPMYEVQWKKLCDDDITEDNHYNLLVPQGMMERCFPNMLLDKIKKGKNRGTTKPPQSESSKQLTIAMLHSPSKTRQLVTEVNAVYDILPASCASSKKHDSSWDEIMTVVSVHPPSKSGRDSFVDLFLSELSIDEMANTLESLDLTLPSPLMDLKMPKHSKSIESLDLSGWEKLPLSKRLKVHQDHRLLHSTPGNSPLQNVKKQVTRSESQPVVDSSDSLSSDSLGNSFSLGFGISWAADRSDDASVTEHAQDMPCNSGTCTEGAQQLVTTKKANLEGRRSLSPENVYHLEETQYSPVIAGMVHEVLIGNHRSSHNNKRKSITHNCCQPAGKSKESNLCEVATRVPNIAHHTTPGSVNCHPEEVTVHCKRRGSAQAGAQKQEHGSRGCNDESHFDQVHLDEERNQLSGSLLVAETRLKSEPGSFNNKFGGDDKTTTLVMRDDFGFKDSAPERKCRSENSNSTLCSQGTIMLFNPLKQEPTTFHGQQCTYKTNLEDAYCHSHEYGQCGHTPNSAQQSTFSPNISHTPRVTRNFHDQSTLVLPRENSFYSVCSEDVTALPDETTTLFLGNQGSELCEQSTVLYLEAESIAREARNSNFHEQSTLVLPRELSSCDVGGSDDVSGVFDETTVFVGDLGCSELREQLTVHYPKASNIPRVTGNTHEQTTLPIPYENSECGEEGVDDVTALPDETTVFFGNQGNELCEQSTVLYPKAESIATGARNTHFYGPSTLVLPHELSSCDVGGVFDETMAYVGDFGSSELREQLTVHYPKAFTITRVRGNIYEQTTLPLPHENTLGDDGSSDDLNVSHNETTVFIDNQVSEEEGHLKTTRRLVQVPGVSVSIESTCTSPWKQE